MSPEAVFNELFNKTARYPAKEYPKVMYMYNGQGEFLDLPIRKGMYGNRNRSRYEAVLHNRIFSSPPSAEIWRIEEDDTKTKRFRKAGEKNWVVL